MEEESKSGGFRITEEHFNVLLVTFLYFIRICIFWGNSRYKFSQVRTVSKLISMPTGRKLSQGRFIKYWADTYGTKIWGIGCSNS